MSLSERADKLQKESGAALILAPRSVKAWVLELLALVRDLAAAIDNRGK